MARSTLWYAIGREDMIHFKSKKGQLFLQRYDVSIAE